MSWYRQQHLVDVDRRRYRSVLHETVPQIIARFPQPREVRSRRLLNSVTIASRVVQRPVGLNVSGACLGFDRSFVTAISSSSFILVPGFGADSLIRPCHIRTYCARPERGVPDLGNGPFIRGRARRRGPVVRCKDSETGHQSARVGGSGEASYSRCHIEAACSSFSLTSIAAMQDLVGAGLATIPALPVGEYVEDRGSSRSTDTPTREAGCSRWRSERRPHTSG